MVIAGVLGLPSARANVVISVNFVGGQGGVNGAGTVNGAAGVLRSTIWNNEAPSSGSALTLLDSNSASAGLITWSDGNNWAATGSTPATNDAALMSGYLDNFNQSGSISVSGLGAQFTADGYRVIVYENADSAGNWGFRVTDTLSTIDTRFGAQLIGGGGNYPLSGPNGYVESVATTAGAATNGNYVTLGSFYGDGFVLNGVAGNSGDVRARINGFEIVAIPEPADAAVLLGLLTLAVAGVVAFKRRQTAR